MSLLCRDSHGIRRRAQHFDKLFPIKLESRCNDQCCDFKAACVCVFVRVCMFVCWFVGSFVRFVCLFVYLFFICACTMRKCHLDTSQAQRRQRRLIELATLEQAGGKYHTQRVLANSDYWTCRTWQREFPEVGLVAEKHSVIAQRALRMLRDDFIRYHAGRARRNPSILCSGCCRGAVEPEVHRERPGLISSGHERCCFRGVARVAACRSLPDRIQRRTPAPSFAFSCFVRRPPNFP